MTPRPLPWFALAAGFLALAACGPAKAPDTAPGAGAAAAVAESKADTGTALSPDVADKADCAGAYAAAGHIDPTSKTPNLSDPNFTRYLRMLSAAIDSASDPTGVGPGNEALKRNAYWKGQPSAAQTARAEACHAKYGDTPNAKPE